MNQRGDITGEETFKGASKSADGFGAQHVFTALKQQGMNIVIHVQDGDSTCPEVPLS